jgi:hypothetical protein
MRDDEWDLFICHAWEDKSFVRPLAESLKTLGLRVWYDEFVLRIGDSLLERIHRGLAGASKGIVVFSKAFFTKQFPKHELRGLLTRQLHEDRTVILPIWHGVGREDVLTFSPPLADLMALRTSDMKAEDIGLAILQQVRSDIYEHHDRADLLKLYRSKPLSELREELVRLSERLSEFQCPYCGAPMEAHEAASFDEGDVDRKFFSCGCRTDGGWVETPCPHTTEVPEFEEYEIEYEKWRKSWSAVGKPKTPLAKKFGLLHAQRGGGSTKEEALELLYDTFLMQFKHQEWRKRHKDDWPECPPLPLIDLEKEGIVGLGRLKEHEWQSTTG